MNNLILDKSNADVAKAVEGCEVGKPQTFTITATPIADNDAVLVANVDSITYSEEQPAEEPAVASKTVVKKPYKPSTGAPAATDMPME